jgi:hypothetical protein
MFMKQFRVRGECSGHPLEPRLQQRYQHLVQEHLHVAQPVAAGPGTLPGAAQSFAATQAAWRFYRNPRVGLPGLAQPLEDQVRQAVATQCDDYLLMMHDWSVLNYNGHAGKKDRISLGHRGHDPDLGYELRSALAVSDRHGAPLAAVWQGVVGAQGLHHTEAATPRPARSRLDEVVDRMAYLEGLQLGRPLVHLIDREADSVGHQRAWSGRTFLVRGKGRSRVQCDGQRFKLREIHRQLQQRRALQYCGAVEFHGRPARQYVGEVAVVVTRPARPQRKGCKRAVIPGPPLPLRLIVSEVRNAAGRVLAVWLLLTNAPAAVTAATLARWYYWRWRIESFFKLLKSAGQCVEQWQQRTALAVAKRLLVASAACRVVWQLQRDPHPEVVELRHVLVRLSGRQSKRGGRSTAPALLAGFWVLLAMLDLGEQTPLTRLKTLAKTFFQRTS